MNRKLQKLAVFGLLVVVLVTFMGAALAAEPHDHQWDDGTWVTEPKCTTGGRKKFKCTVSGCSEEKYVDTDPLGHDWGEWSITEAANCTQSGRKERICSRYAVCSGKDSDIVMPTGHNWGPWLPKTGEAADCTTAGKEVRSCGNAGCPVKSETRDVAALGHNYMWSVTTQPTCTEDGVRTGKCSRCNDTKTETVPNYGGKNQSQGHTFTAWRDPKDTEVEKSRICQTKVRECTECGRLEIANLDKPKHVVRKTTKNGKTYEWFMREPATMNGPGRAVQTCKYCGKVIKSREIKFEGGRYNIAVTAFGPRASAINSALFGLNDRLIPVDFTKIEEQVFALVTDDGILVGEMRVSVMDDTVSVSYQMNDSQTIVSQAVFYMFPDAQSITAADLSDPTRAMPFGTTLPLNGQTYGVIAARLVVNYNAENSANRAFPDSGIYLDGATNNATILQEMTTNLME